MSPGIYTDFYYSGVQWLGEIPGMVFTIEPMINMGTYKVFIDADDPYGWEVYTEDGMPSAQFEKTIVITENGLEVISE